MSEKEGKTEQVVKRSCGGISLRTINIILTAAAMIVAAALFLTDSLIDRRFEAVEKLSEHYVTARQAAGEMEAGSDYLTEKVKSFVVTGNLSYLYDYFEETQVTRRRDQALSDLKMIVGESGDSGSAGSGPESTRAMQAYEKLSSALDLSNELMEREYLAMRLMLDSMTDGKPEPSEIPEPVRDLVLSGADQALKPEEKSNKAVELMFDDIYVDFKDQIRELVNECTQELVDETSLELKTASRQVHFLLRMQTLLTLTLLLIVIALVVFIGTQVRQPLTNMVKLMRGERDIPVTGASELRFVAETYNDIFQENRDIRARLTYEASHDALTGVYNRSAYEMFMKSIDTGHIALLIIDVDFFKKFNDQYGHDVGDRILKKVANVLTSSFRSVDIVCRIGGDEFVVIMTRVTSRNKKLVHQKIEHVNQVLQNPDDGLPAVSLSVGAAFSDRENPQGDIFKDADTALYVVKSGGRKGCVVY